ncbi:MAG: lysoplasmalogenase [Flavobacteriaceae bacterium]
MNNNYLLFFTSFSILNIAGIMMEWESIRLFSKPLLIPTLILFYWNKNQNADRGILIALAFCFLGDILLLNTSTLFFLLGLGSFLVAQIIFTLKMGERIIRIRKDLLIAGLPFVLYATGLFVLLFPKLGILAPAVLVYAFAICCFGILSLTYWLQNPTKGQLILGGALLFIISDSMLALNQFYYPFEFFDLGVMLTYLVAQLFITLFFKRESLLSSN